MSTHLSKEFHAIVSKVTERAVKQNYLTQETSLVDVLKRYASQSELKELIHILDEGITLYTKHENKDVSMFALATKVRKLRLDLVLHAESFNKTKELKE